jgi:hypothetical protein
MRFRTKSAIALGAAAAIMSLGALPAMATAENSTRDSGDRAYVSGCFKIKIYDGNFKDTIYYSNRCGHKRQLTIVYGSSEKDINVGAKKKGSWYSTTTNISDAYDNG